MTSLIYNLHTRQMLDMLARAMPHALLLDGSEGVGLLTTALSIANNHLHAVVKPINAKGEEDLEAGSIKITQIRELYEVTKTISSDERYIVIDNADTMGKPAQNAFLKLLEEPTPNTFFILTAHRPEKLLPTIISRVQRLRIDEISPKQSIELIKQLGVTDARKQSQLVYVAEGLPAEIARLASDSKLFEDKVTYMTHARSLLQGSMLEKIKIVNTYHLKRTEALHLLDAALMILRRSIDMKPTREMIALADTLADAYEKINANGNVRLQLLAIVV